MDEFVPIKMPRSRVTPEVSADPVGHHSPFLLIKLHRDLTKVSIKGLLLLLKPNFFAQLCRFRCDFQCDVRGVAGASSYSTGAWVNVVGRIA